MVVQSVALPKPSGGSREQDVAVVPGEAVAIEASAVRQGGVLGARVVVPMLVVTEVVWLALLGYAVVRILL